jgi:hypothetical protein
MHVTVKEIALLLKPSTIMVTHLIVLTTFNVVHFLYSGVVQSADCRHLTLKVPWEELYHSINPAHC